MREDEIHELVKILESDRISDFGRVGDLWQRVGSQKDELRKFLRAKTTKTITKIREKRLKFLEEDPSVVLTASMTIAGYSILSELKRSQIRKILDMMRNIKKRDVGDIKMEIAKVRYMLAYTSGRNKSVKELMSALDPLLAEVKTREDFEKVYEFFQNIVAFHYFLGGVD